VAAVGPCEGVELGVVDGLDGIEEDGTALTVVVAATDVGVAWLADGAAAEVGAAWLADGAAADVSAAWLADGADMRPTRKPAPPAPNRATTAPTSTAVSTADTGCQRGHPSTATNP
jgi:hypothetical protein